MVGTHNMVLRAWIAEKGQEAGMYSGPVLYLQIQPTVSSKPTAGGSTEDLLDAIGALFCFIWEASGAHRGQLWRQGSGHVWRPNWTATCRFNYPQDLGTEVGGGKQVPCRY